MQIDHHVPEYSHGGIGPASDVTAVDRAEAPLPPRAAYDLWAATYATTGRNPVTAAAAQALLAVLPALAGRRVLDIACGDGRWLRHAIDQGAAWVVGVDFAAGMLASAQVELRAAVQSRVAHPLADRIALAAADMRALPFPPAAFDLAIHALALGHVPDPAPAIRAAAAVLAPGGVLALVDLHPDAAARGWRRTFHDASGRRHEVRWYPHQLAAITEACVRAGMAVERLVERPLDPSGMPPDAPPEATDGLAVYALAATMRPNGLSEGVAKNRPVGRARQPGLRNFGTIEDNRPDAPPLQDLRGRLIGVGAGHPGGDAATSPFPFLPVASPGHRTTLDSQVDPTRPPPPRRCSPPA